jgi:hypothetical protein
MAVSKKINLKKEEKISRPKTCAQTPRFHHKKAPNYQQNATKKHLLKSQSPVKTRLPPPKIHPEKNWQITIKKCTTTTTQS